MSERGGTALRHPLWAETSKQDPLVSAIFFKEKEMSKLLALALGAVLVASAGPALAASPIEFEGYVKVFHESLSNFKRGTGGVFYTVGGQLHSTREGGDIIDRDNFFSNKLQINVTFRPNDQVSVFWQFRGPNYQRWGVTDRVDGNVRDQVNIYTRALYGEVVFPWGTIRGGRLLEGLAGSAGGLASLGYNPSWGSEFLYLNPFDSGDPVDGLTYTNKWDNGFGLAVYYTKQESRWADADDNWERFFDSADDYDDFLRGVGNNHFQFKDNDYDMFGVEGTYEWEGGGVSLGVSYHRDMTHPLVEKQHAFFINPAIYQSWGPFAIHFEAQFGWGKTVYSREFSYYYSTLYEGKYENDNIERSAGVGFYLDGVYNYGAGDVTLATWYADGTSFSDKKDHSLVSLGDFAPFLVAHNSVTLGNGIYSNSFGWWFYDVFDIRDPELNNYSGLTNQWGIAILGNHQITPKIKLNYGIGYFRLVEPNARFNLDRLGEEDWLTQSKDLGWEIDVGVTFQILDNLSFETQFGYMFNGKAFDAAVFDDAGADRLHVVGWHKAKDTFAWSNVLAFTF
jgi:hypothetical protein